MFKQTIETSATPHVTIAECTGNLVVRGAEEQQITIHVQGKADDVVLEREGETFTLTTHANCRLACPRGTTLTVAECAGNLKVEGVEGPVAIGDTHGNVDLRAVGPTALEQTLGNLRVHRVAGELRAQTTRGNARVSQVEGALLLSQVDGNLATEGLQGGLTVERVRGSVRLGPPFSPGQTYQLSNSGNLTVRLPADVSLRLALRAGGKIRSHVPDLTLEDVDGEMQGVLGTGEASLEAQVGGNISLQPLEPEEGLESDFAAGLEGLGARIEEHIALAMAEVGARLEESLSHIDDQAIRQRVERATEKTLRKAGQVAGQARRKAEQEAERARLRAERAERSWRRASGRKSRSKQEPATDEERMRVLRLVEKGKITPEQAADLLAALGGRG